MTRWDQPHSTRTGPVDPKELEVFVDHLFIKKMEDLHIPGLAFVLIKSGKLFFSKGYGFASLEDETPVDPQKTIFPVASVSKLFTATAVMQLYERGKLSLNEDVNAYLQSFQLEENDWEPVTVAHLLTHTAGFDDRYIGIAASSQGEVVPLAQYLAARMPPRVVPPDAFMGYSNHGYALAGHLVEVIFGMSFTQYIQESILEPLGMKRSGFRISRSLASHLAVGYDYGDDSYRAVSFDHLNVSPAGGMVASATDMARFITAQLQDGRFGSVRILGEATAQAMRRRQFTHHSRMPGRTYGFHERLENGLRGVGHAGSLRGFASLLFLLPEEKIGFFVVYNHSELRLQEDLVSRFLDHYYPVREKVVPVTPMEGFRDRAEQFTGSYRHTRYYCRRTFEKLITLFAEFQVSSDVEGTLTVHYPDNYRQSVQLVEIEPFLFKRVNEEGYVAFRQGALGGVTQMFLGTGALEKLVWYETGIFQRYLFGFFTLTFLSGCLTWAIGCRLQPLGKGFSHCPRPIRLACLLVVAVSGLNLVFIVCLTLAIFNIDRHEFIYGVPLVMVVLFSIPLLSMVLSIGLPIFSLLVWKYSSVLASLYYSFLVVTALLFIPFLDYWNLLGFRY